MKKGLLVTTLVAASSLLLASCEKTISYEDARKHVAENFTSTETKMFDCEEVIKVTTVDGLFKTFYKEGESINKTSGLRGVVTEKSLELLGSDATYKVDGKKLSAEKSFDLKAYLDAQGLKLDDDDEVSGKIFGKVSTDEEGYIASEYYTVENLHVKVTSEIGLSGEGNLSLERKVTYTARPAN